MAEYSRNFKFQTLPPIKDIVSKLNTFLIYRTSIRNAAYLIQLDSFLSQINLEKGLNKVYKYNLLRIRADILENLLFCILKDISSLPNTSNRKKPGLLAYANKAKSLKIISKSTYNIINQVCSKRNDTHPSRQVSLFTDIPEEIFQMSDKVVPNTIEEIHNYVSKN